MKEGVLLLNMGGPNNIDEVELFLRNMFADKNILPYNPLIRKFIGNIIVKKRLAEAQENYREIGGKSPLAEITQRLCIKVEECAGMPVRAAMRYVPPLALDALQEFQELGVGRLILFPMYPHYSTTTTLSSVEDIRARCKQIGYTPSIVVADPYHSDEAYVAIMAAKIREALGDEEPSDFSLILSAHGLPVSIIKAGDPYEEHIEANVESIKAKLAELGIAFRSVELAYQSKVGPGEWLSPNLIDVIRSPQHLKILIAPLAFTIDNSETIFELDIEHREIAEKIGYDDFRVARCPNDSDAFAEFIAQQVLSV